MILGSLSLDRLEWGGEKVDRLGSEFWNSSGVSMSELLNYEMVFKTVFMESSETMRGEIVVNDGNREEVSSEREVR